MYYRLLSGIFAASGLFVLSACDAVFPVSDPMSDVTLLSDVDVAGPEVANLVASPSQGGFFSQLFGQGQADAPAATAAEPAAFAAAPATDKPSGGLGGFLNMLTAGAQPGTVPDADVVPPGDCIGIWRTG